MKIGTDCIGVGGYGFIVNGGKVLLIRRVGKQMYELPGGTVEFGEKVVDTIRREVKEETGVEISVKEMMSVKETIEETKHWIGFGYRCEYVSGDAKNMEPSKHAEVGWFGIDSMPEDISYMCREGLKLISKEGVM